MTRTKFIKVLTFILNRAANHGRDILTITGFMDDSGVAQHILREASLLPKAEQADVARYMLSLR